MRSPYAGRYSPQYYSAADVQRLANQLTRTVQVWQQRYEESQAANARLQRQLTQWHEQAEDWRAKYETAEAGRQQQATTPQVAVPETDIEQFIVDLLPFIDNLERALNHSNDSSLSSGVALTVKEFANIIARYGIERIPAEGEVFDPRLHEAVGLVPHPSLPAGTVAEVLQTGYKRGDRLLRAARVMVVAEDGDTR